MGKQYRYKDFKKINWLNLDQDSLVFSEALNNQVIDNFINLNFIYDQCNTKNVEFLYKVIDVGKEVEIEELPLDKSKINETCNKWLGILRDYIDVFARDMDALKQIDFNVNLYVVVLIYNNEYYGHIYTWISPINPNYCMAMGIRSRIDNLFLRNTDKQLSNISYYLLEGVRRFALIKGAKIIVIPYPLDIMEIILPKLNFKRQLPGISSKILGESIAPTHIKSCLRCWEKRNLDKTFIDKAITFTLMD